MDFSDDDQYPWEREDFMDGPPEDMDELGPPIEEYSEQELEGQEQEKPPVCNPASAGTTASAGPGTGDQPAAVLPIVEKCFTTPQRNPPEEPTALHPTPLVAKLMDRNPKLRRLNQKTTVSADLCPKITQPFVDLCSEVIDHSEVFLTQHFSERSLDSNSTIGCLTG